jgi:5'-nucleotidase
MTQPLILLTNDDGVNSLGLWAVAEALSHLGELLVVAPERQWSGAGRSMPHTVSARLTPSERTVNGQSVTTYAIDASPAHAVVYAVIELAPRRPDLVVSGINLGENMSTEVTVSGTVGAALEGATFGIPALAVSLETSMAHHFSDGVGVDYTGAVDYTLYFAQRLLTRALPYDVDVLNVNVPSSATSDALGADATGAWRFTRLSRQRYFVPVPPDRANGVDIAGYKVMDDPTTSEPDSDIWALCVDRVVSVTPLSLDMTSRVDLGALEECFLSEP